MNFFEQQDEARKRTRTLIILFLLALIGIVISVNVVAALLWKWMEGAALAGSPAYFSYPKGFFAVNTLVTVALIVGGTLIETFNLRDGGDAVAKMAGGRMISPASQDAQERRLLNVMAEMALASGIACPKAYVLDREISINAFAAGYNANEAVIAVTRGALRRLTRDELQGVVAHEFSHILNGDMRLNVRLIGVLFGIQMIANFGRHLIDFGAHFSGTRRHNEKGPSLQVIMLALGAAMFVIGYIGVVFGRLIKAAVSRQREFLADASAVQFTRNADGIGGALRKIGGLARAGGPGSRIAHPNAEQLSHLFLGAPRSGWVAGILETHPSIAERLRRIYGRSVELLDAPEITEEPVLSSAPLPDLPYAASALAPAATGIAEIGDVADISGHTGQALQAPASLPVAFAHQMVEKVRLTPELDNAMREPQAACALMYALLLSQHEEAHLSDVLNTYASSHAGLAKYLAASISSLPAAARMPLIDMAMPALKQLSAEEKQLLLKNVERLIAADRRISLAEFVVQTLLVRRLNAHAGRAIAVKFARLAELKNECALLLSLTSFVAASSFPSAAQTLTDGVSSGFLRGAAACPELGLDASDLKAAPSIRFSEVQAALDRCNQLAPLSKPALIKALLAGMCPPGKEELPLLAADLLRAICAALEAPMPPQVAAAYAGMPSLIA